jgi:hypothetical protein
MVAKGSSPLKAPSSVGRSTRAPRQPPPGWHTDLEEVTVVKLCDGRQVRWLQTTINWVECTIAFPGADRVIHQVRFADL